MKMIIFNVWVFVFVFLFDSCKKEELTYKSGDIEIEISTGDNWLHDFPLFLGLSKKNPPQFAIWIEDTAGNYVSTIFATYKIATESWVSNKGNRRKESLPHWCYQRGVVYDDGLYLPTKENPLTDGITGATPKTDKKINLHPNKLSLPFVIKAEFNHSVDFNDFYPSNAKEGNFNYSGGEEGSGQPAIVYATTINNNAKEFVLQPIGHSSPDGSNGMIYKNMNELTSAKSIVKSIKLTLK